MKTTKLYMKKMILILSKYTPAPVFKNVPLIKDI